MKFKITATIPVAQYANIQPEIETEADTHEEAVLLAMYQLDRIWNQYGEKPFIKHGTTSVTTNTVRLKDFFGNEIDYDEVNHVYSWNGEVYESGSQYAKQFEKPFDGKAIATKMATKYKVKAQDILDMWELNARTSREFGTAIHSALELYGKHRELAIALERDSALHSHPVIKHAVETFYKGREDEKAFYEVLIVDHKNKRAGRVDRLLVDAKNAYTVQDFKTNGELKPDKLKVYFEQLKFYGEILKVHGWKVNPPEIHHYDGSWKEFNYKETI